MVDKNDTDSPTAFLVDLVSNRKIPITTPRCRVGRDDLNDIVISGDQSISRFHFIISYEDDQYMVQDAKSRHGTFLNGNQISGPEPINDGDVLKIGVSLFWFVIESQAAESGTDQLQPVDVDKISSEELKAKKAEAEAAQAQEPVLSRTQEIDMPTAEAVAKAEAAAKELQEEKEKQKEEEPPKQDKEQEKEKEKDKEQEKNEEPGKEKEEKSPKKEKQSDKQPEPEAEPAESASTDKEEESDDQEDTIAPAAVEDKKSPEENVDEVKSLLDPLEKEMKKSEKDIKEALDKAKQEEEAPKSETKKPEEEAEPEKADSSEEAEPADKESDDKSSSNETSEANTEIIETSPEDRDDGDSKESAEPASSSSSKEKESSTKDSDSGSATNGKDDTTDTVMKMGSTTVPDWCKRYFSDELKSLHNELEELNEHIRKTQSRIKEIEGQTALTKGLRNTLLTCDGEDLIEACKRVLGLVGWEVKQSEEDKQELLLEHDDKIAIARIIWTKESAERSHLGQLSIAQTRHWCEQGVEPKGVLIVGKITGEEPSDPIKDADEELVEYADKKNVCLMSTLQLLAVYRDLALKDGDSDELRKSIHECKGWLDGHKIEPGDEVLEDDDDKSEESKNTLSSLLSA